jgi:hypothetical protein
MATIAGIEIGIIEPTLTAGRVHLGAIDATLAAGVRAAADEMGRHREAIRAAAAERFTPPPRLVAPFHGLLEQLRIPGPDAPEAEGS